MSTESRSFTNKDEYNAAVMSELTQTELALLNFTIYYNPKHSEYYRMYACGQYRECWEYLMKNRGEMKLENVPENWKAHAERAMKSVAKTDVAEDDYIKQAWLSLSKALQLRPGSFPFQQMESSFFCGACTIMSAIHQVTDENAEAFLDSLDRECEAFTARIKQQRDNQP